MSNDEIDDIMHLISAVLQEHFGFLFQKHMIFEVSSLQNVGNLLKCVRAWIRARGNHSLIDNGLSSPLKKSLCRRGRVIVAEDKARDRVESGIRRGSATQ